MLAFAAAGTQHKDLVFGACLMAKVTIAVRRRRAKAIRTGLRLSCGGFVACVLRRDSRWSCGSCSCMVRGGKVFHALVILAGVLRFQLLFCLQR